MDVQDSTSSFVPTGLDLVLNRLLGPHTAPRWAVSAAPRLLTMLFTCLRLTATIARTPEEDEMSWYDDEDFEASGRSIERRILEITAFWSRKR